MTGLPPASASVMNSRLRLVVGDWTALGPQARAIRTEVFVREQGIPVELEWDDADTASLHCVAYDGDRPVGTGRLLPDGHIGRMAVLADQRRAGVGSRVLDTLVSAGFDAGHSVLVLSAQQYVSAFYRAHGFVESGEPFIEAGIPHVEMRRTRTGVGDPNAAAGAGVSAAANERPPEVIEKRSTVTRPDGGQLAVRDWLPAQAGQDGVYLFHGLGEHTGRYDALARWFVQRGWRVRSHDHRGHGESSGARGTLPHNRAILDDAEAQLSAFAEELGRPPLLLGHSMGGALAAQVAVSASQRLRGLVLSSPALDIGMTTSKKLLASVLGVLAPDLAVSNGLDPRFVSHDAAVVDAYVKDPLVHSKVTARLIGWLMSAGPAAIEGAPTLRVPTLLLVAGDDRLVVPEGSRRFAQRSPGGVVSLRWYADAWHELFNEEPERRQRVLADLDAWLATPV